MRGSCVKTGLCSVVLSWQHCSQEELARLAIPPFPSSCAIYIRPTRYGLSIQQSQAASAALDFSPVWWSFWLVARLTA